MPSSDPKASAAGVGARSSLTTRAVVLGAVLVLVLVITNPYLAFIVDYWTAGSGGVLNGPIAALFLLVLFNGGVKRFMPARAFSRTELLFAYAMASVCVWLAQAGGLPYIPTTTTLAFYKATPENQWETLIWPHIPLWLQLGDLQYASWFWEGAPGGAGVAWRAWLHPLVGWGTFTFALMVAIYCLGALLSKDWIERQRLTFPVVELPIAITGQEPIPSLRTSLLNSRLFWIGFGVPAVYIITDWFNLIYPSFPALQLHDIDVGRIFRGMSLPWNALSDTYVSIIFPVIGISYLVPTEISLSLWLFYIIFQVQMVIWASFGVGPWGSSASAVVPYTFTSFMEIGGAVALCGVIIYRSRAALRSALLGLVRREAEPQGSYLPLSSQWAVIGFVLANLFLLAWSIRAGMSLWVFAAFMGLSYATIICIGFLVASGGVMFPSYTESPGSVLLRTWGGAAFKPGSLATMLSIDSIFMIEGFPAPLAQVLNSVKLFQVSRIRGRAFNWAAALATLLAIVFGLIAILVTIQRRGASTLDEWPWTWPDWSVFQPLAANLRDPTLPDRWLQAAMGIGGAFVLVLVWLQSTFVWWPISPYGFLMGGTYMMNHMMWSSTFIGWLAATVVLRYGGLRLFRELRPIALGLVLGYYITKLPITVLSAVFGVTQRWGLFAY